MTLRILHVIPFLWSGAGAVVSRLCATQRSRWDVAIVTSGTSRGLRDWPAYRRHLAAANVSHHAIDFFDRDATTFWKSVEALERLVTAWRPDVVHTHAGVPACAAAHVRDATRHQFRFVSHVYSWGLNRPIWMNAMDLAGIQRADRVICSARAYRELLQRQGISTRRIAYIPWGLDLEGIRGLAGPLEERRHSGPRIGCLARIEPRKGQLELLHGFAEYRRRVPEAHLELVGPVADDEYARRVADTIRRLRLASAVTIAGHVRNPYRRLARWHLFVSLAADEGQGLAILEAMALGVPVLARTVAGVEDYLVDAVNGWSCPGVSPNAVADGMRRTFADPDRARILARAARMIERRYGWGQTVRGIERQYGRSSL